MADNVNVLDALERCQAYVDDAAAFPELFKPGVVKRDQRQYVESRDAIAKLIMAADRIQEADRDGALTDDDVDALRAALSACTGGSNE